MSGKWCEVTLQKEENNKTYPIFISRDGKWYYNGQEITHQGVLKFFSLHLKRNNIGRHYIVLKNERCPVYVEDTPLLVSIISTCNSSPENFILTLNDGSEEALRAETLAIDEQDNIYCWVRNGKLEARFKRSSYIELSKYLQYDHVLDCFFLPSGGKRHYLKKRGKDDY